LRAYPPKYFAIQYSFSLCQHSLFHYFQSLWKQEEAGGLDPSVDIEMKIPICCCLAARVRAGTWVICFNCQDGAHSAKKMEQVAFLIQCFCTFTLACCNKGG
jgi:hypothetical protein